MGIAKSFLLGLALAATATATSAFAQKSQDTLRLAVNNPFAVLSSFELPIDEASNFSREVYDYLIMYDEYNKTFAPAASRCARNRPPRYPIHVFPFPLLRIAASGHRRVCLNIVAPPDSNSKSATTAIDQRHNTGARSRRF